MWLIAVVGAAPCQCFFPGGQVTTSPGRSSCLGSPQHCVQPRPDVTIRVWPPGCVCQAVRAPGPNVTLAPLNCAGPGEVNSGSMRTLPVKFSGAPATDGCVPLRLISMTHSRQLRRSDAGESIKVRPGSISRYNRHEPMNELHQCRAPI